MKKFLKVKYISALNKTRLIIILGFLMLAGCQNHPARLITPSGPTENNGAPLNPNTFLVTRVIDGDTIEIQTPNGPQKVRYIGIDSPELPNECYSRKAKTRNRHLVENRYVRLEEDVEKTDKYGRWLRYVWVDGKMVNKQLLEEGYARLMIIPPNTKYETRLRNAEKEARLANRGLWSDCVNNSGDDDGGGNDDGGGSNPPPAPPPPQPPPPPPSGSSKVVIRCIFYDGKVYRTESDEYVEIENQGQASQNMQGWVLKDISDGYPSFKFPYYILKPGQRIRVYTNEYHPEWGGFSFNYGKAIWNNKDPDTAALFDNHGRKVSQKSYPPGC